jgi:hypothetical protein
MCDTLEVNSTDFKSNSKVHVALADESGIQCIYGLDIDAFD